ncbi:hypothetical protein OROHE_017069 [Orobanche hederae]
MESSAFGTPKQQGQNPSDVFELIDAIDDDTKLSCTIMNQPSSLQTQWNSGSDNESIWGLSLLYLWRKRGGDDSLETRESSIAISYLIIWTGFWNYAHVKISTHQILTLSTTVR